MSEWDQQLDAAILAGLFRSGCLESQYLRVQFPYWHHHH